MIVDDQHPLPGEPPVWLRRRAGSRALGQRTGHRSDREDEPAAPPWMALDPDPSAEQLHEAARDGQAEARTAVALGRRRVDLAEGAEQPVEAIGGNADARILDGHANVE